jgi:hypothetical protein
MKKFLGTKKHCPCTLIEQNPVLNTSARFRFGRDLKLTKHKVPILIEVKKTAAGLGTLRASTWATEIEKAGHC